MSSSSLPDAQTVLKTGKTYARDLAERVATTALEGFLAGVVVTQPFDLSMWQAAAVGGLAAAVSLVKGMVARAVGTKHSASLVKGV